jgi:transposase
MDTSVALGPGRRRRRKHSAEFKAHVVVACSQPGVSSASVAMANGINANLVRRWVNDAEVGVKREAGGEVVAAKRTTRPAARFMPMALPVTATVPDIRIELQRGSTKVVVTWPAAAATECAAWMRELLR